MLTAISNVDFVPMSSAFTFSAGLAPECVAIMIIDDLTAESEEMFQLRLISSSIPRAVITDPDTSITITDSDRKFYKINQHTYG